MRRDILTLGLGLGAILLAAGQAHAQPTCLPRADLVARLAAQYGETRRAIGLAGDDRVVELFASEATGSWTLTVTDTNGTACLIGFGEAYEATDDAPPAEGDPA